MFARCSQFDVHAATDLGRMRRQRAPNGEDPHERHARTLSRLVWQRELGGASGVGKTKAQATWRNQIGPTRGAAAGKSTSVLACTSSLCSVRHPPARFSLPTRSPASSTQNSEATKAVKFPWLARCRIAQSTLAPLPPIRDSFERCVCERPVRSYLGLEEGAVSMEAAVCALRYSSALICSLLPAGSMSK